MARRRKWKNGIWPVAKISDLEYCLDVYQGVMYNGKFINSSFIKSMTYRTLESFIQRGVLKYPGKIKEEK